MRPVSPLDRDVAGPETAKDPDPSAPLFVEVPLRLSPLGAHIDHQGGIVTGLTVDRSVRLAATPTREPLLRFASAQFDGTIEIDPAAPPAGRVGDWGDYLRAAAWAFGEAYPLRVGLVGTLSGELVGAGLSSSAAVLVAYLSALAEANEVELGPRELVDLAVRAENAYVGVASGRLDPSVIVHGAERRLIRIDCSSLAVEALAAPADAPLPTLLVAFSGVRRGLSSTAYNARVAECREAARRLLAAAGEPAPPDVRLADVDPRIFAEHAARLADPLRRRALHFFSETDRVREGIEAWRRGRLARFGELVTASGESSIANYECGTPPLVALYELLRRAPGVLGTRFSGAGFGGSCLALVAPDAAEQVIAAVARDYRGRFPELAERARFHLCAPGGGVRVARDGVPCRR